MSAHSVHITSPPGEQLAVEMFSAPGFRAEGERLRHLPQTPAYKVSIDDAQTTAYHTKLEG